MPTYLERLRLAELAHATCHLPVGARVLEIGAGAGWQARALAGMGYSVSAIDVAASSHRAERVWPVADYDGERIPFADAQFDVVFSSNVLEHVADLAPLLREQRRVLAPDGTAVHIVPSATWRVWTILAYYPFLMKRAAERLVGAMIAGLAASAHANQTAADSERRQISALPFPPRHGERGNALSEIWHFSRWRWRAAFVNAGWTVMREVPHRLFYTGYELLNERLGMDTRARLSRVLGSSCRIFVLRPTRTQKD